MRRNPPRILAWLSLIAAVAGAPVTARLGRTVPAGTWRWCLTIGTALMILSFFWYPRRGANAVPDRAPVAKSRPRTRPRRRVDAEADAPRAKQRRPAAMKRQGTSARSERSAQSKRPTRREQVERADTGKTRRSKQSSR